MKDDQASLQLVIAIGTDKPVYIFTLRQRYAALGAPEDAHYGSASSVPVTQPMELEVRVSATGLLIRERMQRVDPRTEVNPEA